MKSKVARAQRTPEPTLPGKAPTPMPRADNAVESYRKVEGEILALSNDEVGRVTTHVSQAAAIALGALPNLRKLRDDFVAVFRDAEALLDKLDRLEDYAMAAFYADVRSLPTTTESEVQRVLERGRPMRNKLLDVAEGLVAFGLLDAVRVKNIRRGQGHRDTAQDLVALAALFNADWERLEHSVPFDRAFVVEAGSVGSDLLEAIGIQRVGVVKGTEPLDWPAIRARAFRVLVNQYEPLRRAVMYLRWEQGDANAFAPALHKGRPKRRRAGIVE